MKISIINNMLSGSNKEITICSNKEKAHGFTVIFTNVKRYIT